MILNFFVCKYYLVFIIFLLQNIQDFISVIKTYCLQVHLCYYGVLLFLCPQDPNSVDSTACEKLPIHHATHLLSGVLYTEPARDHQVHPTGEESHP